jgi:hypothetical protein
MQTDAITSSQDSEQLKMKLSKLQCILGQMPINHLLYCLIIEANKKNKTLKNHVVNYDKLMDFVLALGLSTLANKTDHPLAENWQHEVLTLAQEILVEYVAYIDGIKYSELLEPNLFGASREKGLVIPAILQSIFKQGSYADGHQIKDEINALYGKFDKKVKNNMGLELREIIAICDRAIELYALKVNKLAKDLKPAMDIHQEFIKRLDNCQNSVEFEEAKRFAQMEMGKLTQERDLFFKYIQEGICISRSELVSYFTEEELDCFSAHFVQKRASINNDIPLGNINEFIAGTLKPFVQVDKESFCISNANSLYRSLRFHIESVLIRNPKIKERLQLHRGKYLEVASQKQLEAIFEDLGTIYTSVFEKDSSHDEHDIVVIYQKTLLIIECKTTLITDYFAGISKNGGSKLKQQFNKSIQAGYEQALRLKKLIMSQEQTKLYDQQGNVIVTINRDDFTSIECISITLESEGALATSLNILLRKDDEEDYPYSINLRDLTQLATFKDDKEIELTPRKFVRFLKERKQLHGKVFSDDELDYWGCFLTEGSFDKYLNNQFYYLDSNFSKIFDNAWYRKN